MAEWGHSEALRAWILFEELGRHPLLRNRPNMYSRYLLELSERSLKLEVDVEAYCCCVYRQELASLGEVRLPAGKSLLLLILGVDIFSPQSLTFCLSKITR